MNLNRLLSATCLASFWAFAGYAETAPNILLVIADDMGVDASPCHVEGSRLAKMPTLEDLCGEGMIFDAAYAAPLCSPTRATIMTGKYGFRTGVTGVVSPSEHNGLSSSEETLFDVLGRETDYSSAVIGKWHLSSERHDLDRPETLGVDYFYGPLSGGVSDYTSWTAVEQGKRIRVSDYATSALSDKAIDWIDDQSSPWFLWLAYNAPHTPFHAPPRNLHSFGELSGDKRDIRRNPDRYYFAALEAMDSELGRVLGAIAPDERENTFVVFLGDNGTPGQLFRGTSKQGKTKGSLYEGGTNVPLVVTGPEVLQGQGTELVASTDLYSTILGLAGVKISTKDSFDLSPALFDYASTGREIVFTEISGDSKGGSKSGWAIRDARYKLIQHDHSTAELYDLQSDPTEHTDLMITNNSFARTIADRLANAKPI